MINMEYDAFTHRSRPPDEPKGRREYTPLHVRSSHYSALLSNNLYIWGGRLNSARPSGEDCIQDVDVLDCELLTWSKLPAKGSPPPRLIYGCSANDGRRFAYGYGGYSFADQCTHNWVYQLDVDTGEWTQLSADSPGHSPDRPTVKEGADMVYHDGGLVLFGGRSLPAPQQPQDLLNELHVFNIRTGTWSAPVTTGTIPPPISRFTLTKTDQQQAVVLGARDSEQNSWNHHAYILQLNSMNWSVLTFDPGLTVYSHATVCLGYGGPSPELLVSGGQDSNSFHSQIWMFDLQSNTQRELILPDGYTVQRHSHSADVYISPHGGTKVAIHGGDTFRDTCATTTVLLFGVQSLRHLCKTVITDAIMKKSSSLAVCFEPEQLRDKLPPYVPTRIRDCVVSWLRTVLSSGLCMIDLSHQP